MPDVDEGDFRYQFPNSWVAVKFDGLAFYRKSFQIFASGARPDGCNASGSKAVDVVAIEPGAGPQSSTLWLIEQKDFRSHGREKQLPIGQELAEKVLGTLSCLLAGRANAGDTPRGTAERIWKEGTEISKIRFVFHFEQPDKPSRLFPQPIDPKSIEDDLRRSLRAVDPHPESDGFAAINRMGLGWQIARIVR
jgi:hypothetical protein